MSQLEADIQEARGQIVQLLALLDEEERQLRMLEQALEQIGLHSEMGRLLQQDLQNEIAAKKRTIQILRRVIESENRRLWWLEEQLNLRPQPR